MNIEAPRILRLVRGQAGFSLLELMIVVAILAVVAGGMIFKQGETAEKAKGSVALNEMQKVKAAILQFRLDMGTLPNPANPADFLELYGDVVLPNLWNPDNRRGWRGPYLSALGEGYTDIGADLLSNGGGSPVTGAQVQDIRGVADPFSAFPAVPGSYAACEEDVDNNTCLLDWRTLDDDKDGDDGDGDKAHERHGRPYLMFEMGDENRARLMSMGPNGRYDGNVTCGATDSCNLCAPQEDDLLVCLLR